MNKRQRRILDAYDLFDDGDISTERLLALVCDECDCEVDEVVDALIMSGKGVEK